MGAQSAPQISTSANLIQNATVAMLVLLRVAVALQRLLLQDAPDTDAVRLAGQVLPQVWRPRKSPSGRCGSQYLQAMAMSPVVSIGWARASYEHNRKRRSNIARMAHQQGRCCPPRHTWACAPQRTATSVLDSSF